MTCQLRPLPKDLFAMQSAYIPVHWVYLENIILTTRRAAMQMQIKSQRIKETQNDSRRLASAVCVFGNRVQA